MRILIDLRPLMDGRVSGVTVYIKEFLKELLSRTTKHKFILFYNSFKDVRAHFDFLKNYSGNASFIHTKIPNVFLNCSLRVFGKPCLDKLISSQSIDIAFLPDLRSVAVSPRCTLITTFHDLSFERVPSSFSRKTRLWHRIVDPYSLAQRSDRIIAVSEFTKQELVKLYNIDPNKITVIHHGVSSSYLKQAETADFEKIKMRYHLPEKYFLTLSTIEPRKNLLRLLQAYEIFQRSFKDIPLVVAGMSQKSTFSAVNISQKQGVSCVGYIEDADKPALYQNASGFIYISEYEGFGLPVLEALASGCPVMISKGSGHDEIAPSDSIRVSPFSVEEISHGLEKLAEISNNQKIKQQSIEYAKKFTWEKTVDKMLKLFENAACGS